MNVYPLLLALTILFALIALWDSGLMAYPILAGFGFALMMTLRHYSGLWVIGHAAGTQSELLRSFLLRSSIKAATSSPLHLVGAAYAFNLNRFVFILAIALSGFSGGLTGEYEYHRPAAYYGQYSLFDLFGDIDLFAVAGTVAAIAVPIKALRFYGKQIGPIWNPSWAARLRCFGMTAKRVPACPRLRRFRRLQDYRHRHAVRPGVALGIGLLRPLR
jgi:hypothetical protein